MNIEDKNLTFRKIEITNQFLSKLEIHIQDLINEKVEHSYEINEIADLLFIAPNHLSDVVKEVLGKSPCAIYEEKLIDTAKLLMQNTNKPINEIASLLSYDHSNFTKFFKRITGQTPKKFRKDNLALQKTENVTIFRLKYLIILCCKKYSK